MRVFLLIAILLLLNPAFSSAQGLDIGQSFVGNRLALVSSPKNPEPNSETIISIDNYYSAGNSDITWYLNDVEIANSKNKQRIPVAIGDVGSTNNVVAVIDSAALGRQVVETTIVPVYLDIIVEAQTHVPHFYQGRALPSVGSMVNVTALLFGANLSSQNLFYSWKVNGKDVINGTGRGQYKTSFESPSGWENTVSVEVTSVSGQVVASKTFTVPNVKPELRFYEVSTLYGTNERALENFSLISNSATFLAAPFYLDSRVYNNPDKNIWDVNGEEVSNSDNPYEITIERTAYNGVAELGFKVQSTTELLQNVQGSIDINY